MHVETVLTASSNHAIFQEDTSAMHTLPSQLNSCLQQVWVQQDFLQHMQQLLDQPLQQDKHSNSHRIQGFSEALGDRLCRNFWLNWELCNGISWENYAMIPYNILYYTVQLRHRVSFVNLPPDKRNSGCGYLSALFLRITTSINISLYLAIASILVRQIRPGGQQKARNDMIIVSYNGLKLKEDIVEDYCWNCRLIVNWKYASLGKIPNYIHY